MPSWSNCFPQQRLGDVLMVILVEDEADQVGPEVTAGDNLRGQRGDQGLAVWGLPAFAAIADDTGLDDQILDDEIFIALEGRPGRLVDEGNDCPRSVMVNWAVLDLLSDPGRFRPGAGGCRGGVSSRLGAITGRVFSPLSRAISSSSCWMRSCWLRMISSSCRTRGVSSASGISGNVHVMARFYQLAIHFARTY